MSEPRLIVFSSLFPSSVQPTAGLFIRERMFRVGEQLPLVVVSPKPWFPGLALIRFFRPHYRPLPAKSETQAGIEVFFPRFLAVPGIFRGMDGLLMALGSYFTLRRLKARGHNLIDAHFAYPDGSAALKLGRWLDLPVTVTLRGTELPQSRNPALVGKLRKVFVGADKVIAVSESLRRLALGLGLAHSHSQVVGNGVDADKFAAVPKKDARSRFQLPENAHVLITVGGLVERKGFHRVIDCLPHLLENYPDLHYLVVGGPCPEGDMSQALKDQVAALGLSSRVHFLGPVAPESLRWPLSAADVFVLATRNEGWANVILEAMACGLPVVATDVGGNSEVVCRPDLGRVVPFDDHSALLQGIHEALREKWDRRAIVQYARENDWEKRVRELVSLFNNVVRYRPSSFKDKRSTRESIERKIWHAWKHARKNFRSSNASQYCFVAGVQRSGTNMLMEILEWSACTDIFHETDVRAFEQYELRPYPVIRALAKHSASPFFVIKTLCELDRLAQLLEEFRPARALWTVRALDDNVNSALRSFSNFSQQLHRLANNKNSDGWRGRGMSDETQAILKDFDHPQLTEASAAALMWYYRNVLFFEQRLDTNQAVKVVFYEDLVLRPEPVVREIFNFLEIPDWSPWVTRHVHASSIQKFPKADIEPGIREVCEGLVARFENLKPRIAEEKVLAQGAR